MNVPLKNEFSDVALIVAAGGSSSRFGSENKLFAMLGNVPVFIHCIRTALRVLSCVYMAVPKPLEARFRELCEQYLPGGSIRLVCGGETRTVSVLNALEAAYADGIRIAAVQDAARPFLTEQLLTESVRMTRKHGSAIACRKICDTVKKSEDSLHISGTVPREKLWAAETPQTLDLEKALDCYRLASERKIAVTDDSSVMELLSDVSPVIVESKSLNLKITYPEDLVLARLYFSSFHDCRAKSPAE